MRFYTKKFKELRLVFTPMYKRMVGLRMEIVPGVTVEFHNGTFETQDETVIDALKHHPMYGTQFFAEQGADMPNTEGLRIENEKAAIAEEIASQCPECGKQFKNKAGLDVHLRSHK